MPAADLDLERALVLAAVSDRDFQSLPPVLALLQRQPFMKRTRRRVKRLRNRDVSVAVRPRDPEVEAEALRMTTTSSPSHPLSSMAVNLFARREAATSQVAEAAVDGADPPPAHQVPNVGVIAGDVSEAEAELANWPRQA
jgi:hypothetical protein